MPRSVPAFLPGLLFLALLPALVSTASEPRREMRTDRPDATESPFTVEPGWVQFEMDAVHLAREREQGARVTGVTLMPVNVRVGLTRNSEAGVVLTPWIREKETVSGVTERRRGVGDVALRGKLNLAGNDEGGGVAYGILAEVTLPTGANAVSAGRAEAALLLPFAFELGADWSGGAMLGVERIAGEAGRSQNVLVSTVTAGRALGGDWGGFLELTSAASDGSHVATFNFGLTRALGKNAQIDAGVNLGLSRRAPDVQVFTGLSRRY